MMSRPLSKTLRYLFDIAYKDPVLVQDSSAFDTALITWSELLLEWCLLTPIQYQKWLLEEHQKFLQVVAITFPFPISDNNPNSNFAMYLVKCSTAIQFEGILWKRFHAMVWLLECIDLSVLCSWIFFKSSRTCLECMATEFGWGSSALKTNSSSDLQSRHALK